MAFCIYFYDPIYWPKAEVGDPPFHKKMCLFICSIYNALGERAFWFCILPVVSVPYAAAVCQKDVKVLLAVSQFHDWRCFDLFSNWSTS